MIKHINLQLVTLFVLIVWTFLPKLEGDIFLSNASAFVERKFFKGPKQRRSVYHSTYVA